MDRARPPPDAAEVVVLADRLDGDVLLPGEEGYDEARTVWNAMVDRRPALVVRPDGPEDVVVGIRFAREHGLVVSVLSGGHNVAGQAVCEGGLMLDCSGLRSVDVDPDAAVAVVEPGCTMGDVDAATQRYGLATPGGIVSTTGFAGLALGGGWGWLSRSHGLSADNLRAVEVVTADGSVRTADPDGNPDLFWGLRGGGGGLGVVTAFEVDLHPVGPTVLGGVLVYPFEAAGDVLRFHREFTASAPNELCCYASVRTAPALPFIPTDLRGEPIATLYLCHAGDLATAERDVRPLRAFREPAVDLLEPRPYVEMQQLFDDVYPSGFRNYWKSQYVDPSGLSDEAIGTILEHAAAVTSPSTSIVVEHLGGAIAGVVSGATAFGHRDAGYAFNIFTRWEAAAEDDRHLAWTNGFYEAIAPTLGAGTYVNFLSERDDERRVRAAFGENYDRLRAVRERYDPDGVFDVQTGVGVDGGEA